MNIALFGGTFDPVHNGHLAVARAAAREFRLRRIYFVPAHLPPHKLKAPLTAFAHRYAMLAMALAGEKTFIPSLLEAFDGKRREARRPNYTLDTVRRLKPSLRNHDRLFLIVGIDAFMEISTWYKAAELLRECEFIVASRPAFSLGEVAAALPARLRPKPSILRAFRQRAAAGGDIVVGRVTIHLLQHVSVPLSSTNIRVAAAQGKSLRKAVPAPVADYIKKVRLYCGDEDSGTALASDTRAVGRSPAVGKAHPGMAAWR